MQLTIAGGEVMGLLTVVDEVPGRGRVARLELELSAAVITAREIIRERVLVEHGAWQRREREASDAAYPSVAWLWGLIRGGQPPGDPEVAVRAALKGFEAGHFVLLIGERQTERLDDPLELGPDSEIVFLRLAPLRGG